MAVKFPPNARVADFRTPTKCRISYADGLFKPKSVNNSEPKYGCTLIFDKKDLPFYVNLVTQVAKLAWPSNGAERLKTGLIKSPLLMGDGKEARNKETGDIALGLGADKFFIRPNATVSSPPKVHSFESGPHAQASQSEVYSGCYGYAVLSVFPWNHPMSGDGISFGIRMFQKIEDGDSLGGAAPVDSDKWFVPDAEGGEAAGTENPFA